MRKKHKARGKAERAALEQVAAQAGVEIEEAPAEDDAAEGDAAEGDAAEGDAVEGDAAEGHAATERLETVDAGAGEGEELEGAPAGGQVSDRADVDGAEDGGAPRHRDDGVTGDDDGIGSSDEEGEGEEELEEDAAAADPARPQAAALDEEKFKRLIEALVFASDKPLTIVRLRQLTRVSDTRRIQTALEALQAEHADRGIVLSAVSGGYSFRTHSSFSTWVQQLIAGRPVRLSRAQLETLAIVAYRQPITRPEIDQIRGVDSGATLKLLLDRSLIRILGKREEVGRPLLYGTTKEFLDFFSLSELRELPTLREYSELTAESRSMVAKLGGEPLPAPADPVADAVPGIEALPETEAGAETVAETETATATVAETEAVTATETETETEAVTATETVTETETETATETEAETEAASEPEPEVEAEVPSAPEADTIAEPEAELAAGDDIAAEAAERAAVAATGDEDAS